MSVSYSQYEYKTDDNGRFLLVTVVGPKAEECGGHLFGVLSGESLSVLDDNTARVVLRPSPRTNLHALEAVAFNEVARWSAANT